MAKRQDLQLLKDLLEAINRIQAYSAGLSYREFLLDTKTQDAVVRNLEIIGEVAKNLSSPLRNKHKDVPWRDIVGMRDRLIHHYFGTNWEIVWDIIQTKLADLKARLESLPEGDSG